MKTANLKDSRPASELITERIAELSDWRGEVLAQLRRMIHDVDPGIIEEWKWNSPVWSQNGPVCSAAPFSDHVKLNFFKGASIPDPQGLFNAGLDAKTSRAIDFGPQTTIPEAALRDLVRAAVAYNQSGGKKK